MKRNALVIVVLAAALGAVFVLGGWTGAGAPAAVAAPQIAPTDAPDLDGAPGAVIAADEGEKKCGFDSDCSHGKCKSGKCGGCGFDSDCKGWGKCDGGECGGCSFDSDCKGFGSCKSGKCEKSPY